MWGGLTTTAETARGRVGPGPAAGAGDGGGSVRGVARVAAVRQQGAGREGAPVGLRLVHQVPMDHAVRTGTSCRREPQGEVRVLLGEFRVLLGE